MFIHMFKNWLKSKKSGCIPKRCTKTQHAKMCVLLPIIIGPQVGVCVCAHVDIHNYSGPFGEVRNLEGSVVFLLLVVYQGCLV